MIFPWVWLILVSGTIGFGGIQRVQQCPSQELILPCRCLAKGGEFQIWCSHSDLPRVLGGLRAVGQYIFQPIDELILENNNLLSLPGRTFLPLRVMRLMLRYNGLERVSNGWLSGLEKSLMELYLVEPELRSLPEDSLSNFQVLEAVTIQSNSLKRLPSVSGLPKLNYVQIESLGLMELSPRHFKNLPSLEKIYINGSPMLMRLEVDLFADIPALTVLNISYSGIAWINPRAITRLPSLRELSLIGNKIADAGMVGLGIRDLPNLENLYLDFNAIDRLSEASFVDMPALKKISMSNNRIAELNYGAFHRVPMLKTLNLNHNLVRHVHPESFLQHSGSGVEELWLVDNDISHVAELRSLLDTLPRLAFLDMSYNNLEVIPFASLRGHPTLERLNLDFNKIHLVDREAFMAMPALRELSFKNNSLSDILQSPLWNLPALKGLDLSGNFYRRIEPGLLTNLQSLRRLDLSANQIDYVNPLSLLDTPALEYINLSHNSLLTTHPATFRHLIGLYEIDVSNNKLLQFIPGLPLGTEYLHIKRNRISNLPGPNSPDLSLPRLKMLDISYNNLKRIPRGSLRSLPQLRKLYIGNNFLQNLEEDALGGLTALEVFDVENNKLVQVHQDLFKHMFDLKEVNLRENKLNIIEPEMFRGNKNLKLLDVSKNQLKEILAGAFENTRELEFINASHNHLIHLPSAMTGLKNLRVLDVTDNMLGNIRPDIISSFTSLTELHLAQNLLNAIKSAAFDNLEHLKLLYLNNNQLETVETNAFRSLAALKHVKLNENKIRILPDYAFNNLPNLQALELQENLIQRVSNDAFHLVPHLLMLNLSHNLLPSVSDAGLNNLVSLEMLDMSYNRMIKVNSNLDRMEWMVELKMDNNRICVVHGATFNRMPRLRVLSLKNNNMMSFPEEAVQKLRGNLAVLDIDGNPLACSCSLLWLRAWLQESSAVGPRCLDGTLLREIRLSREECLQQNRHSEPVAPGCESELLSVPNSYEVPQVFRPWMNIIDNSTHMNLGGKNSLGPSPEESDYFYDEYVDYPYNETAVQSTNNLGENSQRQQQEKVTTTSTTTTTTTTQKPKQSAHFTPGDTPTIYAAPKTKNKTADVPKEVSNSPGSSGFTFFGVPLPNFELSKLWGNGRMDDKKISVDSTETKLTVLNKPQRVGDKALVNKPPALDHEPVADKAVIAPPIIQYAERKSAIVNKPIRGSGSRGMFPLSQPELQTGFIPILPGSGGFIPSTKPNLQRPPVQVQRPPVDLQRSPTDLHRSPSDLQRPSVDVQIEKVNVTLITTSEATNVLPTSTSKQTETYVLNKSFDNMGHPIPKPTIPTTTTAISTTTGLITLPKAKIETKILVQPTLKPEDKDLHIRGSQIPQQIKNNSRKEEIALTKIQKNDEPIKNVSSASNSKRSKLKPEEEEQIRNISEFLSTTTPTVPKVLPNTKKPDIETAPDNESFEDIFKEIIENVSLPEATTPISNYSSTESNIEKIAVKPKVSFLNATNTFTTINKPKELLVEKTKNSTKPVLLIPGGQQPPYKPPGRPTITKIPSPHLSSSAPLQSNLRFSDDITALPQNRNEPEEATTRLFVENDKSWYFASYNESNLKPYIGPGNIGNRLLCIKFHLYVGLLLHELINIFHL